MAGRFDAVYERLARAFGRHADAPRDPARFPELVDARIGLDDARRDMRATGARFRTAPENDEFVEPGLGTDSRSTAGRVAAVCFVVVAIVTAFAIDRAFRDRVGPLEVVEATAAFDRAPGGNCLWVVNAEFENRTDDDVVVAEASISTGEGVRPWVGDAFTVPADGSATATMPFLLRSETCPASIDDISSGKIRINDDFVVDPIGAG